MNVAIIDDKRDDGMYLSDCLKKYFKENALVFHIQLFGDAADFLGSYNHDYDLILFDIDMPGLNGIEAARELRKTDPDVVLMFVTNMPQYALDGYSVNAVDYIIKPVSYPDFSLKMQRAMRFIHRNENPRIVLNTVEGNICLNISDIFYIESQLHYLLYHTKTGVFKTRSTLVDVESRLGKYHFVRSSISYLVNLKYLQSINGYDIQVQDEILRISRTKKNAFLSAFTKYMGGFIE